MTPIHRESPRQSIRALIAAAAVLSLGAACTRHRDGAPEAEFLLAAGDSTYWLRNVGGNLQMRGSPIVIVRVDGRFRELYVVDEDRSYERALFVGQRLYQRDLITSDSTVVYRDTIVSAMAAVFERRNPEARRLAPDEDPSEDPAITASADVSVLGVHGPFLSLEYHVDTSGAGDTSWHMTRHAVVDLRTGREASLADVLGAGQAATVVNQGRQAHRETMDSVRADTRPAARLAARVLERFRFDPRSFSLAAPGGTLMVAFSAPGAGTGGEGFALPIRLVQVAQPEWWAEARSSLPTESRSSEERWTREGYTVQAEYDTSVQSVRLSVVDSAGRGFQMGTVTAPVHRIYWLDQPPIDQVQRSALGRAFDDAALYDESARTVHGGGQSPSPRLVSRP
ncbi:MAG: hypothetical protein WD801_01460 [Gemmatimonadaceae bacterium]